MILSKDIIKNMKGQVTMGKKIFETHMINQRLLLTRNSIIKRQVTQKENQQEHGQEHHRGENMNGQEAYENMFNFISHQRKTHGDPFLPLHSQN